LTMAQLRHLEIGIDATGNELRAICPKSRKRLSVTRWERGCHPVVALPIFNA